MTRTAESYELPQEFRRFVSSKRRNVPAVARCCCLTPVADAQDCMAVLAVQCVSHGFLIVGQDLVKSPEIVPWDGKRAGSCCGPKMTECGAGIH